jgi:hypothetical protein
MPAPLSCDSVGDALVIRARARWQVTRLADNAASGHTPPRSDRRRRRVYGTCIAGVKAVVPVVDGARLRDARCSKGERDDHGCHSENERHDECPSDWMEPKWRNSVW